MTRQTDVPRLSQPVGPRLLASPEERAMLEASHVAAHASGEGR